MSEFAGFDLDRSTARAWSRFQARLADHLAEMGDDDTLVVDTEVAQADQPGAAPYVQFAGFGGGSMLRGEVSSNHYLGQGHAVEERGDAVLADLGWHRPTPVPGGEERAGSANFFVDLPRTDADRLAVMAVKALREVFGVAHPAFLAADGLGQDPATSELPAPEVVDPLEPLAVVPESAEHLRDLVDSALTPLFGARPERDEDGDVPVPWGSSLVFVRVEEEAPVVQLFSIVAEGVVDHDRAAFEVGVLNRDLRFLTFLLVEDRVLARLSLPAWPFVPEHLRSMLTGMSASIDEIDEDLVARVGGHRALEAPGSDTPEPPRIPVSPGGAVSDETVLMTLLQLDAEGSGTIDVELVAGVCGHDQALIVRLLGETEEQEVAWRRARDEAHLAGDHGEARSCAHEMRAWERTTRMLRRALRLVVEQALGRDRPTGSAYAPDHDARRPRPRRTDHRSERDGS